MSDAQKVIRYVLQASLVELFQVAFSETPQLNPCQDSSSSQEIQIIASIGLAGSLNASLALAVNCQTACCLVSKMLGCQIERLNQDAIDGVAELVNILAGLAKTKFSEKSYFLTLSLPTIITGSAAVSVRQLMKSEGVSFNVQLKEMAFDVYFFYAVEEGGKKNVSNNAADNSASTSSQKAAETLKNLLFGQGSI